MIVSNICTKCKTTMQTRRDPDWPFHPHRYYRCTCGFTVETGEFIDMRHIKLEDWITSSGKYPERAQSAELTQEVKDNAERLLDKVNQFLLKINFTKDIKISSGFRPTDVNKAVGGAKKSGHTLGLAIDIVDVNGELDAACILHAPSLREFSLFLEDPASTKGWTHLDIIIRSDRPNRVFKP